MADLIRLKNVTEHDLDIPALGFYGEARVRAGAQFDCPADIAGEAPGTWRAPTDAEAAEGCRCLVRRTSDDGVLEVLSPGAGLLATGNFEIAAAARQPKKAAAEPADEKEGN